MTFADWFFDKLKGHAVLPAFCTDTLDWDTIQKEHTKNEKDIGWFFLSFYQHFMKFTINLHKVGD